MYVFWEPLQDEIKLISCRFSLDDDLPSSERNIYINFPKKGTTAAGLVHILKEHHLYTVLPLFSRAASVFSTVPATSCSSEKSFSFLKRL